MFWAIFTLFSLVLSLNRRYVRFLPCEPSRFIPFQGEEKELMLSDYFVRSRRELPSAIRAIRYRLGLTQAKFGELLGGNASLIRPWESGELKPAAQRLLQLLSIASEEAERAPLIRELEVRGISFAGLAAAVNYVPPDAGTGGREAKV
jgi:DNA-binding transcriptional regulator YiaG